MFFKRLYFFFAFFILFCLVIVTRLFYWQIIRGDELSALAQKQRLKVEETQAPRGKIYSAKGYPLVLNKPAFSIHLYTPHTDLAADQIAKKLAPILSDTKEASITAQKERDLFSLISSPRKWFILDKNVSIDQKEKIEDLEIAGVGFDSLNSRDYPEASMSAHLLGFLGKNKNDKPQGYFGLEGYYNQQLSGSGGLVMGEKNPFGQSIFSSYRIQETMEPGYNLTLNIDRTVQYILEDELNKGVEKYQPKQGWGVVLNPQSGQVLAMAAFPNYDPEKYTEFESEKYPNPVVANGFEPGSIFKPLVMAAAIEEGVVTPETKCTYCDQALTIGDATIRTWNDQYHPDSTMTEVLKNSDNVGMSFVAEKLGKKQMLEYLDKLGFGKKTEIDLQEEAKLPLRKENKWYPIDVAAASFGQGVLMTPIQFIRAFASLANGGYLMQPQVVNKIWQKGEEEHLIKPQKTMRVYSQKTCDALKQMLVTTVQEGGTKWIDKKGLSVAGKTGTAQIPLKGEYTEDQTIASFVGYSPAENPKYVMLVSLKEPKLSQWGAETAAPIWFKIAERLAYYWNIK